MYSILQYTTLLILLQYENQLYRPVEINKHTEPHIVILFNDNNDINQL